VVEPDCAELVRALVSANTSGTRWAGLISKIKRQVGYYRHGGLYTLGETQTRWHMSCKAGYKTTAMHGDAT
jgi:hypothetical protein